MSHSRAARPWDSAFPPPAKYRPATPCCRPATLFPSQQRKRLCEMDSGRPSDRGRPRARPKAGRNGGRRPGRRDRPWGCPDGGWQTRQARGLLRRVPSLKPRWSGAVGTVEAGGAPASGPWRAEASVSLGGSTPPPKAPQLARPRAQPDRLFRDMEGQALQSGQGSSARDRGLTRASDTCPLPGARVSGRALPAEARCVVPTGQGPSFQP